MTHVGKEFALGSIGCGGRFGRLDEGALIRFLFGDVA